MARTINLDRYNEPANYIAATASATAAPVLGDDVIFSGEYDTVRTFIAYSGTVSAINVRLWLFDGVAFYKAQDTDDTEPLDGSTFGNEVRDWQVGERNKVAFQIESISGGGTATVKVLRGDHSG